MLIPRKYDWESYGNQTARNFLRHGLLLIGRMALWESILLLISSPCAPTNLFNRLGGFFSQIFRHRRKLGAYWEQVGESLFTICVAAWHHSKSGHKLFSGPSRLLSLVSGTGFAICMGDGFAQRSVEAKTG